MTKYHYNPETGKSGRCTAEVKECPLTSQYADGQVAHFDSKAECDAFGEKVLAAQHEFEASKTLQKPQEPENSTGNTSKPSSSTSTQVVLHADDTTMFRGPMVPTPDTEKMIDDKREQYVRYVVDSCEASLKEYNHGGFNDTQLRSEALKRASEIMVHNFSNDTAIMPDHYKKMFTETPMESATEESVALNEKQLRSMMKERVELQRMNNSYALKNVVDVMNEEAQDTEDYDNVFFQVRPQSNAIDVISAYPKGQHGWQDERPLVAIDNITYTAYPVKNDGQPDFDNGVDASSWNQKHVIPLFDRVKNRSLSGTYDNL